MTEHHGHPSLQQLTHEEHRLERRVQRASHNLEADLHAAKRAGAILDRLRKGKPSDAEHDLIDLIEKDRASLLDKAHAAQADRARKQHRIKNLERRIRARRQHHAHGAGAMFDSIDLSQFPANPRAVAGYVGGFWPTYHDLQSRYPNALLLSIAVNASEDADCLDIEPGDATPSEAAAWVRRQHARGVHRPAVYSSISSMGLVLSQLAGAGIERHEVNVWTAHYTFDAHRCTAGEYGLGTTADATQFTDHSGGSNLDESLCSGTIPWHD